MGDVVRDYIPDGAKLTKAEKDRAARVADPLGFRPDFIPDPDQPTPPDRTHEEKMAYAAELAATEPSRQRERDKAAAREKLSRYNVPESIELIKRASDYDRAIYLDAETRTGVLKEFPKQGPIPGETIRKKGQTKAPEKE
jgi:hypothetical protein